MKRSVLALVILFLFASVFSIDAYSQQQGNRMGKMQNRPQYRMQNRAQIWEQLKLTDQQKDKIAELRVNHQKKMIDLKAGLQKAKLDMKDLKLKGDINRKDVLAGVEKTNKIRDEIAMETANHLMDVYEVLTPEQKKIWKDHAPFMNKGMHRPMGQCMGMGMRMHRGGMNW